MIDSVLAAIRGVLPSGAPSTLRADSRDGIFQRAGLPPDLKHRLTWVLPGDALSDGWTVSLGDEEMPPIPGLAKAVQQAAGLARRGSKQNGSKDGGAYILLSTASDSIETRKMALGEGVEISSVHAVGLDEVMVSARNTDVTSPDFGMGEVYQVSMQRGSTSFYGEVHASRLLYVPGMARPADEAPATNVSRSYSAIYLYTDAILGITQGWESSGRLLERRSIPTVELGTDAIASSAADTGATSGLLGRLKLFKESLTIDKLAILMGGDKLTWSSPTVSGTAELVETMGWRLSLLEGIPLTKLFGTPPAGMTSDDAAATATYTAALDRFRDEVATPVILAAYKAQYGEGDWGCRWPALGEPSAKEEAETRHLNAQTDDLLVNVVGTVTHKEARSRLAADSSHGAYMLGDDWDLGDELEMMPDASE